MRVSMVAWLSVPVVSTLLAVLVSVYAVTRLVLASHRPASRRAAVPGAIGTAVSYGPCPYPDLEQFVCSVCCEVRGGGEMCAAVYEALGSKQA